MPSALRIAGAGTGGATATGAVSAGIGSAPGGIPGLGCPDVPLADEPLPQPSALAMSHAAESPIAAARRALITFLS
jgi:hypothetical protein